MDNINQLQRLIDKTNHIVFFGGAGVSTESGIPDFRSRDGLYNQIYTYPPEQILSHSFFTMNPHMFFNFYKQKLLTLDAEPNPAHDQLAKLEQTGKLKGIITQNIDGLHQKAGSRHVIELHGTINNNYCLHCHKHYSALTIKHAETIPTCACGGMIKPDVVLYEEPLDQDLWQAAISLISDCELLIIGGTSLMVYPAAYLIDYFQGDHLVVINKTEVNQHKADLFISDSIASVFSKLEIRS
ncbi:NAD-dependent protein deacylase [Amphibacillus cookii]|uniref:NAD-dependent protein deacylase n=1 Tax=Amphibacillus cookii TaxID=767787 RepID=UPI00195A3DCE|nr:NAD-dependent protein deacylase [Amphibacillus cookii]MBM7541984.1 NAD-dependent deacetylase [Amphibacillus cookii]